MRLGGYFPLRTEQQRFELRVNAGFFDDFGGDFRGTPEGGEKFGGGGKDVQRGMFTPGQVVQVDDRSFQSPGTTGRDIGGDSEFFRGKSEFESTVGPLFSGLVGAGLGIPGLGSVFRNAASGGTFRTDAQGNRIVAPDAGPDTRGNNIANFVNSPEGQAALQTLGGGNVAVTINQAGQLVDNSGALINQQGQRVDSSGRILSESEIAIQQASGIQDTAAAGATQKILEGQEASLGFLGSAAEEARLRAEIGALRGREILQIGEGRGQDFLTGGASRAQDFLSSGAADAQGFLQTQADLGIGGIEQQLGITQGRLDPFTQAGTRALGSEEAFLGLSGPEAQQAAFADFTESPGQQFLREQQEQALLRGSAAIGGLGGGRVRGALQEQAFGIASTRLDDQLNRLSQLSGRGQQTAAQQGQFGQAAQGDIASILAQLGGRQSGVATDTASRQAGVATDLARGQAGIATGTAANFANVEDALAGRLVGIQGGLGTQQAGVATGASTNLSNLILGTGEQQAGAVLGQQAVRTGDLNEQRRLQAQQQAQQSQQDAAFNQQLLGLGASIAGPALGNFFSGLF